MFSSWYKKLLGNPVSPNRRVRRATRTQLGFEFLEDRTVPTFLAPVGVAAGASEGAVVIGDFNGDG